MPIEKFGKTNIQYLARSNEEILNSFTTFKYDILWKLFFIFGQVKVSI